jgi:hypothetical protein
MKWPVLLSFTLQICLACSANPSTKVGDAAMPGEAAGPGISVGEALAFKGEGPLLVRGWLVLVGSGDIRLCSSLSQSEPPRCGEPSLVLKGIDLKDFPELKNEGGTIWKEDPVLILGDLKDKRLVVAEHSKD